MSDERGVFRPAVAMVLIGAALALAYNWIGLKGPRPYGIEWVTTRWDLDTFEPEAVTAALPQLPDLQRPIQMQLPAVKQFYDADGAVFVDARPRDEYEVGHIAGAINLPYEEITPDEVEAVETGGRPVITYCDGGDCEMSTSLAWDFVHAGERAVVFQTGFPAWEEAGYPTAWGPEPGEMGGAATGFSTDIDDPMAIFGAGSSLPEIPDTERPTKMALEVVKQFYDAQGALMIDAREPEEFAAGHIPDAINLPYDQVTPDVLEALDTGGRPIIVYCGGGTCEVSISLAWDLLSAGHKKVLVYEGGFPEWEEAGYPVRADEGGDA